MIFDANFFVFVWRKIQHLMQNIHTYMRKEVNKACLRYMDICSKNWRKQTTIKFRNTRNKLKFEC